MNKYRLPPEVYDRRFDNTMGHEEIKKKLVGDKFREIIDAEAKITELMEDNNADND